MTERDYHQVKECEVDFDGLFWGVVAAAGGFVINTERKMTYNLPVQPTKGPSLKLF
jgi:hypothetical protein